MSAEFYYPERALAFFVIALIVFYIFRAHRLRRALTLQLETNKSLDRSESFHAPKNRLLKESLFIVACLLIVFSIMRPRWGEKERLRRIQGLDVCIALDLSQSMLAEDISPNRLKAAKREVSLALEKLSSYRVAAVGFAGGAFVASPLTQDLDAVADLLSPLSPDFVSHPSTYIQGALITCGEALGYMDLSARDLADDQSTAGLILLVTDGDDQVGIDSNLLKGLVRQKISVSAYLVGKEQETQIPIRDERGNLTGFVKDPRSGAAATTRLNYEKIQELVEETGGKIYLSSQTADFASVFSADLEKFSVKAREEGVDIEKEEQFQIPLLIAFLLLLMETLLTETGALGNRLRKRYLGCLIALLPLNGNAVGVLESLRNNLGVFLFERGNFESARKLFEKNIQSSPEDPLFVYNWSSSKLNRIERELQELVANSQLDEKQVSQHPLAMEAEEISKILERIAREESNPSWKKKWYFQSANALELAGKIGPALDAYYNALKGPEWKDLDLQSKHNLARLLRQNSNSGGSGGGGGEGGGSGGEQSSEPSQGNADQKKPQDYKGQNFTPDEVKQILQNVGSEERNVIRKKSKDEAQQRAKNWGDDVGGALPW